MAQRDTICSELPRLFIVTFYPSQCKLLAQETKVVRKITRLTWVLTLEAIHDLAISLDRDVLASSVELSTDLLQYAKDEHLESYSVSQLTIENKRSTLTDRWQVCLFNRRCSFKFSDRSAIYFHIKSTLLLISDPAEMAIPFDFDSFKIDSEHLRLIDQIFCFAAKLCWPETAKFKTY